MAAAWGSSLTFGWMVWVSHNLSTAYGYCPAIQKRITTRCFRTATQKIRTRKERRNQRSPRINKKRFTRLERMEPLMFRRGDNDSLLGEEIYLCLFYLVTRTNWRVVVKQRNNVVPWIEASRPPRFGVSLPYTAGYSCGASVEHAGAHFVGLHFQGNLQWFRSIHQLVPVGLDSRIPIAWLPR